MKKESFSIRLIGAEEYENFLPIFKLINPELSKKKVIQMLQQMFSQGYQCAIVFNHGKCIGLIGMWIHTKFYAGKHIEYDNLFLLPKYRRNGIGKMMIAFANHYAFEQGCISAELTCDIKEKKSQKFWKKNGFNIIGLRYQINLIHNTSVTL